jgi:hypothetical protein
MKPLRIVACVCAASLLLAAPTVHAADADEYKIKREQVFEFAEKPVVTRNGDDVTVRFQTKAYCDVTVAIEENSGAVAKGNGNAAIRPRILRHLACGVLGVNAPPPFEKNTKKQTVVWDGKDDLGKYVDDKDGVIIRVSLGLKPRFERTLYWHPMKRVGLFRNPFICARPEGVYMYEGAGVEMVRLYAHDGTYLRTVYPFRSSEVKQVAGIEWKKGLDGFEYPQKQGYWRASFLKSGRHGNSARNHAWGSGATCFTVSGDRIAIAEQTIERLGTRGGIRGVGLSGPNVYLDGPRKRFKILPHSVALSPDAKTLYLAGYFTNLRPLGGAIQIPSILWTHGVYRMEFEKNAPPALWKGEMSKPGKDAAHFNMPAAVACDVKGRVYVADHFNDRVQVFSPAGKLLHSIRVNGPSRVQIHHKTGEIYVFSWRLPWPRKQYKAVAAMLRKFGPLPAAKLVAEYPLPLKSHPTDTRWWFRDEDVYRAALDSWSDPAKIWLVTGSASAPWRIAGGDKGRGPLADAGARLFVEKGGKLERVRDFHQEVARAVVRVAPPIFQRQRMYVDPRSGTLYLGEGNVSTGKSFGSLLKIDPATAKLSEIRLPIASEDMAIDANGLAYLRAANKPQNVIGRFDLDSWRQVPFDYGERRGKDYWGDGRTKLLAALIVPSHRPVYWHQSGMDVTARGELVVSCYNRPPAEVERTAHKAKGEYSPRQYPGRYFYGSVHVWDKHGKVKHLDTVPGLPDGQGTCVDLKGDIYLLIACHRLIDGKQPYGVNAGTIVKFKPGKGKLTSSRKVKVALSPGARPKGPPQLSAITTSSVWASGAEWMYSGIGVVRPSAPCQCWNSRFDVDYFGRTFAPETDRSQVAVLDTNGNLMLHIGRYGNVDEGLPLVASPYAGSKPAPLGGDEVSFVYPVYVATHTDRRVYVADPGNGRIVGVKLGYHTEAKVLLKSIPDRGGLKR